MISGDIVEIYDYSNPIFEGYEKKENSCGRQNIASDEDKKINRTKVLNRAKREVRRCINANIGDYSKFITLTFRDNITNLKQANYEFKKFRQKLERYLKYKLQYVAVVEFQERGAIHYHVVMFNAPYIKNNKLNSLWGNGFVRINCIDNVDNVGAYVCKYMSKDFDDDRLKGEKMWFRSRNLEKSVEIKDKKRVENIADALPPWTCVYDDTFENDYNNIHYMQYNMKFANESTKNKEGYL